MSEAKVLLLYRGPAPAYEFIEVDFKGGHPVAPKDSPSYYLRYSENGKRKVEGVGKDLTLAYNAYQHRELNQTRVQKGLLPIQTEAAALVQDFKSGGKGITIVEAAAQFIEECEARVEDWRAGGDNGLSPASVTAYKKAIANFVSSCAAMGAVSMSELKDPERGEQIVAGFKVWLQQNTKRKKHGKAAHTDQKKFTVIGQFLAGQGVKMKKDKTVNPNDTGLVKRNVVPYVKKPKATDVVYYTPQDLKAMLSAASTVGYKNNNNKPLYDAQDLRDLLLLFVWTGMRDEEIQHLEWSDVNGKITVQDKPKWDWRVKDHEKRLIVVNDELRKLLDSRRRRMATKEWKEMHVGHSESLLFSNSLGNPNQNFADAITGMQERAILGEVERAEGAARRPYQFSRPECRHKILHLFRHTFATMLGVKGQPSRNIQFILGHSDLETTERYLAVVDDPDRVRKDFDSIKFVEVKSKAKKEAA